jgi:hypothetical protein
MREADLGPLEQGICDAPAEELTREMRRVAESNARALDEILTSSASDSRSPAPARS